jgi:type I restriction enzyme, S subunit
MSDQTVSFSELVSGSHIEVGAGRPRSVQDQYPSIPILRVADVLDGRIEPPSQDFVSDVYRKVAGSKISKPGDVVLTAKGTVGRVALMPTDGPDFAYSPQLCYFRPAASGPLRSRYLYYWFKSTQFWNQADALKGQTDMADYLSLSDILALKIRIPSLDRQDDIIEVLGSLDEKIAVNDRITGASDELIRQTYVAVSFDVNETIKIGDLASQVHDTVPVESLRSKDNYIGLEHMPRRNVWLREWDTAAAIASAKTRFHRGDVLFGKLRPYFHKVGIAFVDGVSSTDILVIRPKRDSVHGWLLAALSSDDVVAHASAVGNGTRMPRANWSDLATYQVPWPGSGPAQKFNQLVMPLVDRIGSAVAENRALAELRDRLLPKLMSGEIRVRDAEKVVEDVT